MPPKAVPDKAKRKRRGLHPFECVLCVVLLTVVILFVLVLVLGVLNAVEHANDDDDFAASTYHHHHHHHVKKQPGVKLAKSNSEMHTLQALQRRVNENALLHTGWLPDSASHAKRDATTLFAARETNAKQPSVHSLDLREHRVRISDDTYYLGSHPHPHEPGVQLDTYAFLHYASPADDARKDKLSSVERTEKHKHFNRTQKDVLRHHKHKRQVIECGAPIAAGARWKQSKGFVVHPRNAGGYEHERVVASLESSADTWRCVFQEIHQEPLGPLLGIEVEEDDRHTTSRDFRTPSGTNRIAFAQLFLPEGGEAASFSIFAITARGNTRCCTLFAVTLLAGVVYNGQWLAFGWWFAVISVQEAAASLLLRFSPATLAILYVQ